MDRETEQLTSTLSLECEWWEYCSCWDTGNGPSVTGAESHWLCLAYTEQGGVSWLLLWSTVEGWKIVLGRIVHSTTVTYDNINHRNKKFWQNTQRLQYGRSATVCKKGTVTVTWECYLHFILNKVLKKLSLANGHLVLNRLIHRKNVRRL